MLCFMFCTLCSKSLPLCEQPTAFFKQCLNYTQVHSIPLSHILYKWMITGMKTVNNLINTALLQEIDLTIKSTLIKDNAIAELFQ